MNADLFFGLVLNTVAGASAGFFRLVKKENHGKKFTVSGNGSPLPVVPEEEEKKKRFFSAYGIFPGICGAAYGFFLNDYFSSAQTPPYLTQVIIAFIVGYIGHIFSEILDGLFADRIFQKANGRSDKNQFPDAV